MTPEPTPVNNTELREKAESRHIEYLVEGMTWDAFADPKTKELIDRASELRDQYDAALRELGEHLGIGKD